MSNINELSIIVLTIIDIFTLASLILWIVAQHKYYYNQQKTYMDIGITCGLIITIGFISYYLSIKSVDADSQYSIIYWGFVFVMIMDLLIIKVLNNNIKEMYKQSIK